MMKTDIYCPGCRSVIPVEFLNSGGFSSCRNCFKSLHVSVFPALFRENEVRQNIDTVVEGESSCFYHPQKKAIVPCDSCGRFLCSLCELDLNGQRLCPVCLETGKKKEKIETLTSQRVRYDKIAMVLALLPALCVWPSLIGAPIALFLSIRYRKKPTSLVNPTKVWYTVAAALASLEILGWAFIFLFVFFKR